MLRVITFAWLGRLPGFLIPSLGRTSVLRLDSFALNSEGLEKPSL